MDVCMCVCVYVCMCVWNVCMHVCVWNAFLRMCVCMGVCIYVCVSAYVWTDERIAPFVCARNNLKFISMPDEPLESLGLGFRG